MYEHLSNILSAKELFRDETYLYINDETISTRGYMTIDEYTELIDKKRIIDIEKKNIKSIYASVLYTNALVSVQRQIYKMIYKSF